MEERPPIQPSPNDHRKSSLLPLKAVMFLFYGATATFLPYITLHLAQIGISIEEIGIINAILPLASCLGPPLTGLVASRTGWHKPVLMVTLFGTGAFHTLLMMIDTGDLSTPVESHPSIPNVFVSCDQNGETFLQWQSCSNETCLNEIRQKGSVINVLPSDCYHSCGNSNISLEICLLEHECQLLHEDVFLQLQLEDGIEQIKNSDLCSLRVPQMLIFNSSDLVRVNCQCQIQCPAFIINALHTCPENTSVPIRHTRFQHAFWIYLMVRMLATACLSSSFIMLEASVTSLLKKHKADPGKQRMFGVFGSALFALASGILIDWIAAIKGYTNYAIPFWCADILLVFVIVFLTFVDVTVEKPDGRFWRNVQQLARFIDVDIFMSMSLLLGTCWGFLETYLFIFLAQMKAPAYLLGLTVALGSLICIPFFYISNQIITRMGKIGFLLTAFFIYCLRFFAYSFIQNPWWSLPFEALEAVSIHLTAVAMSMFCASSAPLGLLATLQTLSRACYYSIGKGLGSVIGGLLIATYGNRATFRTFGTAAALIGTFYIGLYLTFMRKYHTERLKAVGRWVSISFHVLKKAEGKADDSDCSKKCILRVQSDEYITRRLSS